MKRHATYTVWYSRTMYHPGGLKAAHQGGLKGKDKVFDFFNSVESSMAALVPRGVHKRQLVGLFLKSKNVKWLVFRISIRTAKQVIKAY